jgi:hypothetical protein
MAAILTKLDHPLESFFQYSVYPLGPSYTIELSEVVAATEH